MGDDGFGGGCFGRECSDHAHVDMDVFYRAGMQLAPALQLVGMVEEQDIKLLLDVDEAGIPDLFKKMVGGFVTVDLNSFFGRCVTDLNFT